MAVDYLFVSTVFSFVTGITFTILGQDAWWDKDDESPRDIIYTLFGSIALLSLAFLSIGTDNAWMRALSYLYWGLGLLDFSFVLLMGVQRVNIWYKNRRYRFRA